MIKQTITYKDLDGNEKSEDYWFQLTEADFTRKALTHGGEAYLERLRSLADLTEETVMGRGQELMDTFETILFDAVGRREGDLFIKDESITRRFRFSGAYDKFFLDILGLPDSGASFFKNVFPKDLGAAIDKALAEKEKADKENGETAAIPELEAAPPVLGESGKITLDEAGKDERPKWLQEEREPTQQELIDMPRDEMMLAFKMREEGKLKKK